MDINDLDTASFIPGLSVDNVIFGFHNNQLKVLLLACKDQKHWMLPGGYVLKTESVDAAAERVLFDRTGLHKVYLQQFSVFGDPKRSSAQLVKGLVKSMDLDETLNQWFLQRFITIGYYALVEFEKVKPIPDPLSLACDWFDIDQLPRLIFDHQAIIEGALIAMRQHLNFQPIGLNLLPSSFPLKSLQLIYETILGKKLDRPNFNRKILSLGILEKKEKQFTGAAHKAPFLYSFKKKEYYKLLKEGIGETF
ncbi:MAG: NUDIX hydrolase [Sediminibacterium sp.]|jgi:ADP-ribose pyrophosphatase YjhB (NUDIX family)|nr:MAG: NUDIX hydrolase [Sediminibacterium sp.] [Sediminibacterium sp. FEMGT703S]